MKIETKISALANLIGDDTRAAMLVALMGGTAFISTQSPHP